MGQRLGQTRAGRGAATKRGAGILLAGILALAAAPAAALTNGDFSNGLDGWDTFGPVSVDAEELVLADGGPGNSAAWQAMAATASRSILSFELLGDLSSFTPSDPFGFPDVFAASIYLTDDATGFDPATSAFDDALSVLTLDWTGPYDVNAVLTPSVRGGDWVHVAIEFDSPYAFVVPTFELFELAVLGGDSTVRIDDVSVIPVPEMGTGALFAFGLLGLARRRSNRGTS